MRMELRDRRVTVVGLARSGVGAANLLAGMGAEVTVTDLRSEAELAGAVDRLAPSVRRVLGGHPQELFMSAQMIVVSPGVPLEMKQIIFCKGCRHTGHRGTRTCVSDNGNSKKQKSIEQRAGK